MQKVFSFLMGIIFIYTTYIYFSQPTLTKPVTEMGKLYPDDLGEKVVTRTDIDYVIMIKEKKEN